MCKVSKRQCRSPDRDGEMAGEREGDTADPSESIISASMRLPSNPKKRKKIRQEKTLKKNTAQPLTHTENTKDIKMTEKQLKNVALCCCCCCVVAAVHHCCCCCCRLYHVVVARLRLTHTNVRKTVSQESLLATPVGKECGTKRYNT